LLFRADLLVVFCTAKSFCSRRTVKANLSGNSEQNIAITNLAAMIEMRFEQRELKLARDIE